MFQIEVDLVGEESGLVAVDELVEGVAAGTGTGRVACLREEVVVDRVKEAAVVVLDFAEFEEVFGRDWALRCVEVDHDVAEACDDED